MSSRFAEGDPAENTGTPAPPRSVLMRHPLFYFFVCLTAGVAADMVFSPGPALWFGTGAVAVICSFACLKRKAVFISVLAIASVFLGGGLRATSLDFLISAEWKEIVARARGRPLSIEARVASYLKESRPFPGRVSVSFIADGIEIAGRGRRIHPRGAAMVFMADPGSTLRYGDRVRFEGVLSDPDPLRNPAGFDQRKFLASRGAFVVVDAKKTPSFSVVSRASAPVDRIKNRLLERIGVSFGNTQAAFAKALLLGERAELPADLRNAFVRTGTMHLFAISGTNVALLILMLLGGLRLLRVPERGAAAVAAAAAVFYCALTGGEPPVFRATVMALVFLGGRLLGRGSDGLNSLGLAGALMLFLRPEDLADAGFQLSFAAVWALAVLAPRFFSAEDFRRRHRGGVRERAAFDLKTLFVACAVAWAATVPIAARTFYQFNLLAPFVNFLAVPVVFLLNIALFLYAPVALAAPAPPPAVFTGAPFLIGVFECLVRLADRPGIFFLALGKWSPLTWVLFAAGLYLAVFSPLLRRASARLCALFLGVGICALFQSVTAAARPEPYRVVFFDVGQGDAAFFEFGKGGNLLVDTGKPDAAGNERVITPYLLSRGVRRIDAVVVSHPQFDHCGALASLVRDFEIGLVIGARLDDAARAVSTSFYRDLLETIEERGVRRVNVRAGDRITGFRGVEIEVLHPARGPASADANEDSVVLRIGSENTETLMTGDIGEESAAALSGRVGPDGADILKVPHHGSRIGDAGKRLLRILKPRVAVIQAGKRNPYGHPHPATAETLARLAGAVYRTDRNGAVEIRVDRDGHLEIRPMIATAVSG